MLTVEACRHGNELEFSSPTGWPFGPPQKSLPRWYDACVRHYDPQKSSMKVNAVLRCDKTVKCRPYRLLPPLLHCGSMHTGWDDASNAGCALSGMRPVLDVMRLPVNLEAAGTAFGELSGRGTKISYISGRWALPSRRSTFRVVVALVVAWLGWLYPATAPLRGEDSERIVAAKRFDAELPSLLRKHCSKCHSGDEAEAGIRFDEPIEFSAVQSQQQKWEKVLKMVESGAMPPDDQPQPSSDTRRHIVTLLRTALYSVDCTQLQDPGRVTIRRLNRAEYDNTLRDLLGVDLRLAREFPSDDVGYGFDNIADVLAVSPLLVEKYLDAAEKAVAAVIQEPDSLRVRFVQEGNQLQGHNSTPGDDGLHGLFSSDGRVTAQLVVPRDGRYRIEVTATADQAGKELAMMEWLVDGKALHQVQVPVKSPQLATYAQELPLKQGRREVAVRFVNDFYQPDHPDPGERDRNLYVRSITLYGPMDLRDEDFSPLHRRHVIARPQDLANRRDVRQAARTVLEKFLFRAFRRPVPADEVRGYVDLVELAVQKGDSYEQGIRVAMAAALVSPHFLFRLEIDPQPAPQEGVRPLNDFEIAVRLSYFLWSSMPDDELFDLAMQGKLRQPEVLQQQVRRMLQDAKAWSLAENFAAQWLNLRNLNEVQPDPNVFPEFNDQLRRAMLQETLELFMSIVRQDRSVLDFLTADYTFANRTLARWYGLPDASLSDDRFQQVSLRDSPRRGILTHASILTLTSNPGRTSPVKRGKWIMENILGTPPPEPPANVPLLEDTQKAAPNLSLRQQLELHRKDPTCAACHRQMDTLGFGFENFDAVGRWRSHDGRTPIDASGELPEGGKFDGVQQLIAILAAQKSQFARVFAEKMLTFALGRGLEYTDQCAVREVVSRAEREGYRFSAFVSGIVQSRPFLYRRVEEAPDSP